MLSWVVHIRCEKKSQSTNVIFMQNRNDINIISSGRRHSNYTTPSLVLIETVWHNVHNLCKAFLQLKYLKRVYWEIFHEQPFDTYCLSESLFNGPFAIYSVHSSTGVNYRALVPCTHFEIFVCCKFLRFTLLPAHCQLTVFDGALYSSHTCGNGGSISHPLTNAGWFGGKKKADERALDRRSRRPRHNE